MMVIHQWSRKKGKGIFKMDIAKYLDEHENKDLLRFLTCGSVDDGKSTLIGRLLYDSKLIYDDQLSKLKQESENSGNKGDEDIDYSLLLDGLKAEREQGITIDVAYRYFSTPKRKFIIADTPGHEQYTRNMATGASTADCAVILIDARKGVITQTRRHSFIVSLLGIKHVIIAVNKMDLVDYDKEVFENIRKEFEEFSKQLDLEHKYYIPLSALKGDNVVDRSEKMTWYNERTLLDLLESINVSDSVNLSDFRFPVQYVNRPNLDFRGFSGSVVSGIVSVGDSIQVLPSKKESKIKRIVTADGDLSEAFSPQAVTLVLEDEIDISSGDMIVHASSTPKMAKSFESMIVWMNEEKMEKGKTYLLRQGGKNTKVRVDSLEYSIDVNSLKKDKTDSLSLNGIGKVVLSSTTYIPFDSYTSNKETGSIILIDPISNTTVGAGMIIDSLSSDRLKKLATNKGIKDHVEQREFLWESGIIRAKDRAARNHHKGKTVLITGTKGVGKRELAAKLEKSLFDLSLRTYYLGMANVKGGLDSDIDDQFLNRDEHIRRLGELARIMTDAGLIFISTFDDADEYDLERIRQLNEPNELIVVNMGKNIIDDKSVTINLEENPDIADSVKEVLNILSVYQVIPEYCI